MTAVGLYTLAVNRQVAITERSSMILIRIMREETRNEIRIMREFNELQVRETDKKIDAWKDLAKESIKASEARIDSIVRETDKKIDASKELAKESIKASEARIDTILLKFMVQYKKNDNEMK